jgi:hypothetical protein
LPVDQLCSKCQGPLVVQGYCPVCEHLWKLAAGEPCPKHEVPLEEQRLTTEGVEGEPFSGWVTLESYADDTVAEAHRLRLESEGIPTLLENERMGSRAWLAVATGGVGLKVPEENAADARVILAQNWTIPDGADPAEADDEWEGLAPDAAPDRRRRFMKAIVWFMVAPSIITFVIGIIGLVVVFFLGLAGSFSR